MVAKVPILPDRLLFASKVTGWLPCSITSVGGIVCVADVSVFEGRGGEDGQEGREERSLQMGSIIFHAQG